MFYLFANKPDSADMELRGSDTCCVPQEHVLNSGESVWLVSGNIDTSGLSVIEQFDSPEEFISWRAENCQIDAVQE